VWVGEGTESAWLSPNSGFRAFFLDRIRKLARLPIDALWIDVPLYHETGSEWADASKPAVQAYRSWASARRIADASLPGAVDPADQRFLDWVRFRHENLAAYVADIQRAARAVKPSLFSIGEVYPMDYMDAMTTGLDATFLAHLPGLAFAWEIDAVSNRDGMKYASIRDMHSQIAMLKWGAAVGRGWPGVGFSYGKRETDAALVMGAVLASGLAPLECRIPDMTASVGSAFRARSYSFLADHAQELTGEREAKVGVWYSSSTRDRFDFEEGGYYGKYVELEPVIEDPQWWAEHPDDSPLKKPHLGGWRAAAHYLLGEKIPFRPLIERPEGAGPDSFGGLEWIWLPSVRALSESDAERLRRFVEEGGRILAAGHEPGTHDRYGRPREEALLADLFPAWNAHDRATHAGNGFALARPGVTPEALFDTGARGDSIRDALSMNVMPHVDPVVRVEQNRVYLEIIRQVEGENRQSVALVDLIGVQRPVAPPDRLLDVHFRPPAGARRITAHVSGPGRPDRRIPIERGGTARIRDEFVSLSVRATPFAFVTFRWETAASDPPVLSSRRGEVPSWLAEPIESAMTFVKESMRNASLP
ncbi:MAG: hypothetical protein HKN20_06845, partial [Gemmatimonadetes bacterium]|nr:hypothetical protein [Gemmatimonadota bacterium]